jgi:hypothetical protein
MGLARTTPHKAAMASPPRIASPVSDWIVPALMMSACVWTNKAALAHHDESPGQHFSPLQSQIHAIVDPHSLAVL